MRVVPTNWPFASHSKHMRTRHHNWHVQRFGQGPKVLLIHGTGAATHSWKPLIDYAPDWADYMLIDLPGHGYTDRPRLGQSSISAITNGLEQLLAQEGFQPDYVMGHSAGAVIAVTLGHRMQIGNTITLNAAFSEFSGIFASLFPMVARTMLVAPFVSRLLAHLGRDPSAIKRILQQTGSIIPQQQLDYYHRLFETRDHIQGTLQLMADWSVGDFITQLPSLGQNVHFITAANDLTVSPQVSKVWFDRLPHARLTQIPSGGHLIQEEAPDLIWHAAFGDCS